jgi:hypothetical protein
MTTSRTTLTIAAALVVALAATGCGREPAPAVEAPEPPTPSGLEAAAATVDGWQLDGEPQIFVGEALFELINGGAELYHQLGFVRALSAEYVDGEDRAISLEVFEMGDLEGTKQIFAEKTGGSGEPADIGDEAAVESYYMNARVDRYLITITGFESDEATTAGILKIGAAVATALGGQQ